MKGMIIMKGFYPEGFLQLDGSSKGYTATSLLEASAKGTILEAMAYMCDSDHNLLVSLGSMKGIIPRDEGAIGIKEGLTKDIALISRVGKSVCFIVEDIKTDQSGKKYALLSRRKPQELYLNELKTNCRIGDIIDAKITHLESFGAFCDIGCGIIALLPIDSISISRISHPRDRFTVGENIKVIIKNIGEDGKITLSHKELLGTWEENAKYFLQGETVSGIVRSIESYGIFIELAPNLAGLAELKPNVHIGQTASVYIKSVIPEKMKIKLIIIDSFDSDYTLDKKYFYLEDHIDSFSYSPEVANKKIDSYFNNG